MRVTINDVARQSKVSAGAVSQVLRDPKHPRFSPETRERILVTARNLGYVANSLAGGLRRGRTQVLSLVLPWNTPELMDVTERVAAQLGYSLMVQFTPDPDEAAERKSLHPALERRVDGIIWLPARGEIDDAQILLALKAAGTRLVVLEAEGKILKADVVDFDYAGGGRRAIAHLQAQGYRRIIHLVCSGGRSRARRERARQFLRLAQQAGAEGELLEGETEGQAGAPLEHRLRQIGDEPVAFYCEHDLYALDVLRSAQAMKLAVPQQVGIVAMGDLLLGNRVRFGELTVPAISSVPKPFGDLARSAVELLVRRLREEETGPEQLVRIPLGLCVRQTSTRTSPSL